MPRSIALVLLLVTASIQPSMRAAPPADAARDESADRMAWWRDAKFGMFIHWGIYSMAGGEWNGETNHAEWLQLTAKIPLTEYTRFATKFNPTEFDADRWVEIAKEAGMGYLVVTAKHHDGLAMYDSPSSGHDLADLTQFGRDPLRELAQACERQGIRFCVYYSLGRDWEDPDVPTGTKKTKPGWRSNLLDFPNEKEKDFAKYFQRKVKPQVRELLTNYGPIGVMWFDTPERITPEQSAELLALIRELQPDCIVNHRVGNGLGDYGTPEQTIPTEPSSEPWETCMTLNQHWGYNRADEQWKSAESLVRNLIDIVSKGGNYLLNVGPTGEGVIPGPSVVRLGEVGEWLDANGEAIYGCGPTPFGAELGTLSETRKDRRGRPVFDRSWKWRATTRPDKLYIHLLEWPDGVIHLPPIDRGVTRAYLLAAEDQADREVVQSPERVSVALPDEPSGRFATVLCLELE